MALKRARALRRLRRTVTMAGTLLVLAIPSWLSGATSERQVQMAAGALTGTFLLHTSYEHRSWQQFDRFMTSRSRIVEFERQDDTLAMFEATDDSRGRLLARIPIRSESAGLLALDFNAAFDRIFLEEDRIGEDYYGRVDRQDYSAIPLPRREIRSASRSGATLVLEQHAIDELGRTLTVHYYLRPYRPSPGFEPFEMANLEHFGLYETYPQRAGERTVLYATKFDIREPIVFALSSVIPARHRQAVREGVLYWNLAFGRPIVRVIDAPARITAPHPEYNVIGWEPERVAASTSHIQTDPLTGEILHAHIFILPRTMTDELTSDVYNDHLRYLVAHEVGHALGLRHNFAEGPVSTVMNYFPLSETVRIGQDVIALREQALAYDRSVIRNVYLGESLDIDSLPAFCTDYQDHCLPERLEDRTLASVSATEVPTSGD